MHHLSIYSVFGWWCAILDWLFLVPCCFLPEDQPSCEFCCQCLRRQRMISLETVIQSATLGLNSWGRILEWDWDLCDFSKTGSIRNCSVVVVMVAEFWLGGCWTSRSTYPATWIYNGALYFQSLCSLAGPWESMVIYDEVMGGLLMICGLLHFLWRNWHLHFCFFRQFATSRSISCVMSDSL